MYCDSWALPTLFEERCTLCGLCAAACPNHGIRMSNKGPVFEGRETCDACGTCEDACPEGAIVTEFGIVAGSAPGIAVGGRHA